MPKIYKPNRVTMHPNNETIDPTISNAFSFVFAGVALTYYEYTFYELFSGEPALTLSNSIPTKYNGDVVYENIPSSFWALYPNYQLAYDIHLMGENFNCSGTATEDFIYIPGANYGFAERVFIADPLLLGEQDVYVVPSTQQDYYYVFNNAEAARNGLVINRLVVQNTLSGISTKAHVYSEQIPFRTATQPSFILSTVTAYNALHTVTASYSQANGYALNSFTFYVYDMDDNLLLQTDETFSSNPKHTFEYLANGEQYQLRFTGKNVINQSVDTGKVNMTVTYPTAFTQQTVAITGENQCQYGRIRVTIPAHSPTIVVPETIEGEPVNHTFTITNTLVYRENGTYVGPGYTYDDKELIAVIAPDATYYNDYMAQNSKVYRYSIAFYGTLDVGEWSTETSFVPGYNVINNSVYIAPITSKYYGWFLIDLDGDKAYKFDAMFDGGELTQEDDYTEYKTNLSYNAFSVGNTKSISGSVKALVSVDNLNSDFHNTNAILKEISDLISPRNTNRKLVKDRRTPTRIFPVFTNSFSQMPLNNGIGYQPYLCSFNFKQIGDTIE